MSDKTTHSSLAIIVLIGISTFLYQMAGVLDKIQTWEVIWNPPTVAQMFLATASAIAAVLAATKLDIPLLKSLLMNRDEK